MKFKYTNKKKKALVSHKFKRIPAKNPKKCRADVSEKRVSVSISTTYSQLRAKKQHREQILTVLSILRPLLTVSLTEV